MIRVLVAKLSSYRRQQEHHSGPPPRGDRESWSRHRYRQTVATDDDTATNDARAHGVAVCMVAVCSASKAVPAYCSDDTDSGLVPSTHVRMLLMRFRKSIKECIDVYCCT